MNEYDGTFWVSVLTGVIANLIWFGVTAFLAAAYLLRKDRSKFNGRWKSDIRWKADWAKKILAGVDCTDPHSEGEISLSYGSGANKSQYWGLSVWRFREGSEALAELCVELHGIELIRKWSRTFPFFSYTLIRAKLNSRIRHELGDFRYAANFANYEITFSKTSEDLIEGRVRALLPHNVNTVDVGSFTAERIA